MESRRVQKKKFNSYIVEFSGKVTHSLIFYSFIQQVFAEYLKMPCAAPKTKINQITFL